MTSWEQTEAGLLRNRSFVQWAMVSTFELST